MDFVQTFFNLDVLVASLPQLMRGFGTTVQLGLLSIAAGLVSGLFLALVRLYAPGPFRLIAIVYIDIFRAFPILVLLVIVYYALPFVGLRFSSFASAALTLTMVSSAYSAEIFRAGIEAVPKGQFEAARALGLRYADMMRDVVLPQAVRIVVPPITNNSINVMKDTALASVVAMPDLLKQATQAQALHANPTPLIGAALVYLLMLLPLVRLVAYFERRFSARRN